VPVEKVTPNKRRGRVGPKGGGCKKKSHAGKTQGFAPLLGQGGGGESSGTSCLDNHGKGGGQSKAKAYWSEGD